jgi:hypothetical protein
MAPGVVKLQLWNLTGEPPTDVGTFRYRACRVQFGGYLLRRDQ